MNTPVAFASLNPCSNGICSLTALLLNFHPVKGRLNPCSNGICSLTVSSQLWTGKRDCVLILVLMEYAL